MEITKFVVSHRNEALLVGDYGSYRRQLSRRLLTLRRRLGRASPKGKKYVQKTPISVEDVDSNPEYADSSPREQTSYRDTGVPISCS